MPCCNVTINYHNEQTPDLSVFSIRKCLSHSEDVVEVGTGIRGEGAGKGGGSQRGHLSAGEAHGGLPVAQSVSAQGEGDHTPLHSPGRIG